MSSIHTSLKTELELKQLDRHKIHLFRSAAFLQLMIVLIIDLFYRIISLINKFVKHQKIVKNDHPYPR